MLLLYGKQYMDFYYECATPSVESTQVELGSEAT